MTEIYRPPYLQGLSAAGLPLSGAKLYFYEAGTTNEITIYQDDGLTTPHTNPVIADSAGVFPPIYLNAASYKTVLTTSADVIVQTVDDIIASTAVTSVLDSQFRIQDEGDITKQAAFQASGISAGTTRTYTLPDKDGTLATTDDIVSVPAASNAEVIAGIVDDEYVSPATAYFHTGHVYGLSLTNNGTDATNDIDIAAGTARDASDTVNMRATALTKRADANWSVGTNQGGLDTGSVANTTYYVWLIKRSDTGVVDVLFSASNSAPTMPANYDYKLLIGEFVRAGGTNGKPVWYPPKAAPTLPLGIITPWVAYTPTFTGFGTVSNVAFFSRRVGDSLQIRGKFTVGTSTAVEARISLGFNGTDGNVTSDAVKVPSLSPAGNVHVSNASSSAFYALIESNVAYLTFGIQNGSNGSLNKANGNGISTNGISFAVQAETPIAGW